MKELMDFVIDLLKDLMVFVVLLYNILMQYLDLIVLPDMHMYFLVDSKLSAGRFLKFVVDLQYDTVVKAKI
jgi:hypothetical protein